jgi:hypothetical protein
VDALSKGLARAFGWKVPLTSYGRWILNPSIRLRHYKSQICSIEICGKGGLPPLRSLTSRDNRSVSRVDCGTDYGFGLAHLLALKLSTV